MQRRQSHVNRYGGIMKPGTSDEPTYAIRRQNGMTLGLFRRLAALTAVSVLFGK
jgi:hypothetical protein